MPDLRRIAAVVLEPVRRFGRNVAWTPDFMGLGNLLQLAMWAYDGRSVGQPRWIRSTPRLDPWLEVFPGLRTVVVAPTEVRFTDRRVRPWSHEARRTGVRGAVPLHEQVDVAAVERFLREVVLPESVLAARYEADGPQDALIVNVRRGDYYDEDELRQQYGFDVATYVRVAVENSVGRDGRPPSILVVSDDVEWCRRQLGFLSEVAPTTFGAGAGSLDDFVAVATARRAVLANSTFSYWAAHISNILHADNHAQIWAPRFFDRTQNGGRSWLLDERWSIVEELPGGWDEPDWSPGSALTDSDERRA